jgi:hypothetical protein
MVLLKSEDEPFGDIGHLGFISDLGEVIAELWWKLFSFLLILT